MEFKKFATEWAMLLIGVLAVITSALIDIAIPERSNWFARSGSLLVLCAAVVEYRLLAYLYDDIHIAAQKTARKLAVFPEISDNKSVQSLVGANLILKPEPPKSRKTLSLCSHIMIILGTAVWGYGDVIQ